MASFWRKCIAFVNNFSLWVLFGALSSGYFFYAYFNSHVHPVYFWLLPTSMWMIYTLDHVFDGRRNAQRKDLPDRYAINYQLRGRLLPVIAFITGLNAWLALRWLSWEVLITGGVMAVLSMVYLWWVSRHSAKLNPWLKEIFIALMASMGMGFIPLLQSETPLFDPGATLLLLVFFLISLINVMTFSHFDVADDRSLLSNSTALKNTDQQLRLIRQLLLLTYLILLVWMFFFRSGFTQFKALMVPLAMINLLMIINTWEERFKNHGLYRFWGDFIYLLPGLFTLWFGI